MEDIKGSQLSICCLVPSQGILEGEESGFKADDVVLGIETVVTAVEMKESSVTILIVLLLDSDHHRIVFVNIHGSNCDKEGKFQSM